MTDSAAQAGPSADFVIVGGGQAGCELAFELRRRGYAGGITLLGAEPLAPYQRPPLSKDYLLGKITDDALQLRHPETYEKAGIALRTGQTVTGISPASATLRLAGGEELSYSQLALTTGGRARRLPVPGNDLAGIFTLRGLQDITAIRAGFAPGRRLVIVGGGYIGLELAAVAIKTGLEVTLLETAPRILSRVAGEELAAFYTAYHRERGVKILTGVTATEFLSGDGASVCAVACGAGRHPADMVVVGIGLIPATELAQAAGLAVEDGILVDAGCRTSDPAIFAIGDCARYVSPFLGRSVRLESVPNAIEMARVAAAQVCGQSYDYKAPPWFWSDQYDLKLQSVGLSAGHDATVLRGEPEAASFAIYYLRNGVVIAADVVNRPKDFILARRLVAGRLPLAAEADRPAAPASAVGA